MKKKIILLSCGILVSAFASFVTFKTVTSVKDFENGALEALAVFECLTSPGDNTGRCREGADGSGNYCVKANILKNCYNHIDVK